MRALFFGVVFAALGLSACNCGGGGGSDGGNDGGGASDAGRDGGSDGGSDAGTCVNLQCRQVTCDAGTKTTVTGVVTIPSGALPLHNATVYVPNTPVAAIATGASCDLCETAPSGSPLVVARTDTQGRFVLENVPAGANVPLVVQVGKWRKESVLPNVQACADNAVPDAGMTRLPSRQAEGHLPRIGIATGGADTLECLLKKVGVDENEFSLPTGPGRVNIFAGYAGGTGYADGGSYPPVTALWNDAGTLEGYDVLLLSCEGQLPDPNKTPAAAVEMQSYLHAGGRVFGSHLHQYWLVNGPPPFPSVATFGVHPDLPSPFTCDVDTSFPRGQEFAQWLQNTGASSTLGKLDINAGQHSIESLNSSVTTRWIYGSNPATIQYFSFKAPIGAPASQQCGRFVLTDIHVSSGDVSSPSAPFPTGCTTTSLSAQEKALVYMLFDLSNCVASEIN
jgi:hypothetical protein